MVSRRVVCSTLAGALALATMSLGPTPVEAVPPGAATLVGPAGLISGTTLAFTWQAATDATFYYLQVNDATASPRVALWYPADQACPAGSATCTAVLTTGWAVGAGTWWVQTWNPDGYGPWSAGLAITVNAGPAPWAETFAPAVRFQIVMGGAAVLDRETGLVWERFPGATQPSWHFALINCRGRIIGSRKGWRLPTLEEADSLLDPSQTNPALPAGHPFGPVPSTPNYYWTATTRESDPSYVYAMVISGAANGLAAVGKTPAAQAYGVWCVRGGGNTVDNPR